jgi:hypothetical protein
MKVHVLLRGQHYMDDASPYQHKFYKRNFLYILRNFDHFFLQNLKSKYDVSVSLITWESPIQQIFYQFADSVQIFSNDFFGKDGHKQFNIVAKGLEMIPENDDSVVIIFRLDTILKKPVTEWFDLTSEYDIVLPWKETGEECWKDYFMKWKNRWSKHRVGDIFYFLKNSNNVLQKFKSIIQIEPIDGHEIYDHLKQNDLDVKFCVDGYFDSDTSKMTSQADNPLFLLQRPYHHFIDEFELKLIDSFGEPLYGY